MFIQQVDAVRATSTMSYSCSSCARHFTRKDNMRRHEIQCGHSHMCNASENELQRRESIEDSKYFTTDEDSTVMSCGTHTDDDASTVMSCGTHTDESEDSDCDSLNEMHSQDNSLSDTSIERSMDDEHLIISCNTYMQNIMTI